MNKDIELCGINLGDTFDENKFKITKKRTFPDGHYIYEIANFPSTPSKFFKKVCVIHPVGSKEISAVIAHNGGGYSRDYSVNFFNELHNYYLEKYGNYYDIHVNENDKALFYHFHFYPPNYNVISFKDPESSKLKEPVTSLLLMANQDNFKGFTTLEAVLTYYEDEDDDKLPEELDNAKEKTFLKVAGLR